MGGRGLRTGAARRGTGGVASVGGTFVLTPQGISPRERTVRERARTGLHGNVVTCRAGGAVPRIEVISTTVGVVEIGGRRNVIAQGGQTAPHRRSLHNTFQPI